ncbi:transmembrane amino acid transporter protein-domain-containing protein [Boletus reticuloceps]|uniref:Transmembrane amino acid transporter protein-domain-containing protein n=1 Tax=Boletus reticuloceps TaxID=495285 RepID=A0A8I2YHY7_9AGAM|nr:transmembrane amino acid transporter protein-domain-containing protein [Boletus reticuloceps]
MSLPPMAVEAHDPRAHLQENHDVVAPEHVLLDDGLAPNFETYLFYALEQRNKEAAEARKEGHHPPTGWLSELLGLNRLADTASVVSDEKKAGSDEAATLAVSPAQYRAASSSLRTATWGAIFYLITTDILGPYSAPYAFSQVGYGPGVACFVVFGVMAAYSGILLWHMFLKLDSDRFPLRSFGDLGYRIFGNWFRILCNVLQSLQLIFNVGLIILGNGQGLSQVAKFKLCFIVCNIIWTLAGMILGQIRTLQKFGWVANFSIWLHIIVITVTMGAVAHTAPDYEAAEAVYNITAGPVHTVAINQQPFQPQLNGIMQIVFAYGGAMIFIEFMAEMRRPMDFWKAMACAQAFITIVYMFFGLFVYSYQGQFVLNRAFQGISLYSLQTATNIISFISSLIAAALYGNIGVKVIYQIVLVELFHAPPLTAKSGKYLFAVSVIAYWALAFVIGSAVPQFSNISSLVAAVCIFQFSYTFPPFMILGYLVQLDAMSEDRSYDIKNPHASRIDSWRNLSRWVRGYKKHFIFNTWNLIIFLACLATAALASYTSITSIISGFHTGTSAPSFGCRSPLQTS